MWRLLKHLWKRKKMGKTYTRWWMLRRCRSFVSFTIKEIKDTKKESGKKCLENSWAVFNSVFLINKGPSHTLKGLTFFFTTFSKMCIIQITWNMILSHWHVSPAINYGKLFVPLFLKILPAPTSFCFFFWFAPDDSLKENNKTLTTPLYLINPLRIFDN